MKRNSLHFRTMARISLSTAMACAAAAFGLLAAACTAGQQLGHHGANDGGFTESEGGGGGKGDNASSGQPGNSTDNPAQSGNGPDAQQGDPPVGAKRFFVTSSTHDGKLGGLAGANQRCTLVAEGAGL